MRLHMWSIITCRGACTGFVVRVHSLSADTGLAYGCNATMADDFLSEMCGYGVSISQNYGDEKRGTGFRL